MLQIANLRINGKDIAERLIKRGLNGQEIVANIIDKEDERKQHQIANDELLAKLNNLAVQIGGLFKEGKQSEAILKKEEVDKLKFLQQDEQSKLKQIETQLLTMLNDVPNAPHISVPEGKSPADNKIVYSFGTIPDLSHSNEPHWDIVQKAGIIDFELGVKITGAGFPIYLGDGAKLQRALINFFLDEAASAGYLEVQVPILVNQESAYATGQLPDKEGQMYYANEDKFYLIPTAEVPITNIFRDTILQETSLPQKRVGYTPCFRREAGSYGKDVRGLNRLHQFDKVEIVQITHPEKSYQALEEMVNHVKMLLEKLELPYRILLLCGGDMGFTSAMTYDFEVWSAAQEKWLEVSSTSCFETYQANRLKCRFKNPATGKNEFVHTLNGSALALPRIVAALIENNQQADGRIMIPKALQSYFGKESIVYEQK